MTIKAVIFDMDGVITNSEQFHTESTSAVLNSYGAKRTQILIDNIIGMPEKEEWVYYKKVFPQIKDDVETLMKKKQVEYKKIAKKVVFFPGFTELLINLKENNMKIGLTTSNIMFYINYQLTKEVISSFDAVTSADDIKKGKPDPEPYLKTIKKLNIKPNECVVIEDAINGIKSARSAGAYCIAVTNTFPKEKLTEADMIISSLTKLTIEKIKKIGEN